MPLIRTCPDVTGTSRVTHRPSVLLPLPDSPTRPSTSPVATVRLTPSTARTGPKCLTRSTISRVVVVAGACVAVIGVPPAPRRRRADRPRRRARAPRRAQGMPAPHRVPGRSDVEPGLDRAALRVGVGTTVGEGARLRRHPHGRHPPGDLAQPALRMPGRVRHRVQQTVGVRMAVPREERVGVPASSTTRPAYMTTTRSAMSATTPRSWVISRTAVPISVRRSRSTSRIPAWTVTSSAVVGSSATRILGRQATAMAIITRCRIPPESWCGYSPRRRRGQRDADEVEQLGRPVGHGRAAHALVPPQHLADLATDGQHRVERGHGLLEDVRDVSSPYVAQLLTRAGQQRGAAQARRPRDPGVAGQQPGQRQRGDALAAARLADQREHLALADVEGCRVDGEHRTVLGVEPDGQVPDLEQRQRRSSPGLPRVEGVAHPVAEQVERERDDHDGDPREAPPSTGRRGRAAGSWPA